MRRGSAPYVVQWATRWKSRTAALWSAVREAVTGVGPPPQSVFGALDGGYTVLVEELVRRAGIRWAQVAVGQVNRAPRGWELVDDEGERWLADAAVLAVPAPQLPPCVFEE